MKESMEKRFSGWKTHCLGRLDASRRGRLDEDVAPVVSLLNGCEAFFTTSSCSGRVVVVGQAPDGGVQKQNCVWLFVSHIGCKPDQLESCLDGYDGDGVLKFEPFVLHVQCRELRDAQLLHSLAVQSGFRNSGLSVGKNGKIMAAVRSTHSLEVPLSHRGKLLVTPDYIKFLAVTANQKMEENLRRIHRFYRSLREALAPEELQELQVPDASGLRQPNDGPTEREKGEEDDERAKQGSKSTVYKRRRKQGLCRDGCHGDRGVTLTELEDCLDLFT